MPNRDGTLKAREFVFYCEDQALAALPDGFPRPERRVMWTILQLHYGNPQIHFELQPHVARGIVELGLHFEGPPEVNDAWAARVASHARELSAALGPEWELEEWTASWRRLHRTWRFTTLTADLAREVAEQLGRALVTLQPLITDGRIMPSHPDPARQRSGGERKREARRFARGRR